MALARVACVNSRMVWTMVLARVWTMVHAPSMHTTLHRRRCTDCASRLIDACVRCETCLARLSAGVDASVRAIHTRALAETVPGTYAHAQARLGLAALDAQAVAS